METSAWSKLLGPGGADDQSGDWHTDDAILSKGRKSFPQFLLYPHAGFRRLPVQHHRQPDKRMSEEVRQTGGAGTGSTNSGTMNGNSGNPAVVPVSIRSFS